MLSQILLNFFHKTQSQELFVKQSNIKYGIGKGKAF
jgi:hypothetical protein